MDLKATFKVCCKLSFHSCETQRLVGTEQSSVASGGTNLHRLNGKYENNLNTNINFGKVRPLQNTQQKWTWFGNKTCFF